MEIAVLDIITVLSVVLIIAVGPYIKKVTNNWFFWIILGGVLMSYLIVCRFYPYGWSPDYDGGIPESRKYLLDICPFCALAICVAVVIDPTRKLAKIIAPFALFGGLITILGGIGQDSPELTWQYIFIGNDVNPMYFMMHWINVVMGILVLVSVPKMRWADWIYCNLFAGCYYSYVAIMMTAFNLQQNVSGLCIFDWSYGEYSGVSEFFGVGPGAAAAIGFSLSYVCISLIIFLQNRVQLLKRYRWYDMFDELDWFKGWYQLRPTTINEPKSVLRKMVLFTKRSLFFSRIDKDTRESIANN
ncbi:MAG: DUF5378 domain-containing protein [Mycoplasmataceae bacterium]|nr:DUF5378 domain-containing protein [Mycoplasmataceae bacterium]